MKNGPYELIIAPTGYPGFKYRGRYCYEHIAVWWQVNGVVPQKGWEIHHVNGEHRDNRISNLRLVTSREHKRLHGAANKAAALRAAVCYWCDKPMLLKKSVIRSRSKKNAGGRLFCSARCGALNQFRGSSTSRTKSC